MENYEDLTIDDVLNASKKDVETWHKSFGNSDFVTFLKLVNAVRKYERSSGLNVWDSEGKEYTDFFAGVASLAVGHNHPRMVEAIEKVLPETAKLTQSSLSSFGGALKAKLAAVTPGDLTTSFLCHSGAEAVEGAIKLARAATGRKKLVSTEGGYHGKTMGALSITGKEYYQIPFRPLIPECYIIPYNDLKELEKILSGSDVAAFIVEPIQGEAGVIIPDDGYLKGASELCKKYGTLLIADEVQTGIGRTGRMFACEWEDVTPDVMTMAKSLSGGMVPIGAFITTRKIWQQAFGGLKKSLQHTTTLGGNTLACAAAIETLNIIKDENLVANAEQVGGYFIDQLKTLADSYGIIKEVRGKGLLIGVEFVKMRSKIVQQTTEDTFTTVASLIASDLLNNHNVITGFKLNNPNTIRLVPPLSISREEVDAFISALSKSCAKNKSYTRALFSTAKNLLR